MADDASRFTARELSASTRRKEVRGVVLPIPAMYPYKRKIHQL
jgi:hypothetical protein